jgi:hypothetical protein
MKLHAWRPCFSVPRGGGSEKRNACSHWTMIPVRHRSTHACTLVLVPPRYQFIYLGVLACTMRSLGSTWLTEAQCMESFCHRTQQGIVPSQWRIKWAGKDESPIDQFLSETVAPRRASARDKDPLRQASTKHTVRTPELYAKENRFPTVLAPKMCVYLRIRKRCAC